MRASAKAKRSRTWTGEVWWLSPMTQTPISRIVNSGQETESPERKEHKGKTADGAPGEAAPALGKPPVQNQQGEVECPNDQRPDHFGIAPVMRAGRWCQGHSPDE